MKHIGDEYHCLFVMSHLCISYIIITIIIIIKHLITQISWRVDLLIETNKKEGNVLFNDSLKTFYLHFIEIDMNYVWFYNTQRHAFELQYFMNAFYYCK